MTLAVVLWLVSSGNVPWHEAKWLTVQDPGKPVIDHLNAIGRISNEPSDAACKKLLDRKNDTPAKMCELLTSLYRNRQWYGGGDYPAEVAKALQWANRKEIPASLACSVYMFSSVYHRGTAFPPEAGERIRKLFPSNYMVAGVRITELTVMRKWPLDRVDAEAKKILAELTKLLPAHSWQTISFEAAWHYPCLDRENTQSRAKLLLSAYERLVAHPSTPTSLRKKAEGRIALLKKYMSSFKP